MVAAAESGDGVGRELPAPPVVVERAVCGATLLPLPTEEEFAAEFLASESAVLMTISCFVSLPLPPMLFRLIFIFRPLSTVA